MKWEERQGPPQQGLHRSAC